MRRLAAFLSGINLGSRRVKMEVLRGHFEDMGLEGVESLLASGNVVFDDPGADRPGLEAALGDGENTRRKATTLQRLTAKYGG